MSDKIDFELGYVGEPSIAYNNNVYYYTFDNSPKFATVAINYGTMLAKVDGQVKNITTNELEKGKRKFYLYVPALNKINGKPFFMYFAHDNWREVGNLKAAEIDTATLALSNPKIIASTGNLTKKITLTDAQRFTLYHSFITSPNGRGLTFICKEDGQYLISVIDENLNILWTKEGKLDYKDGVFIQSIAVDNNGVSYISYKAINSRGVHILITPANGA